MLVITTAAEYDGLYRQWKAQARANEIALVPTMGALHEGHAALIQLARETAQKVVVSIFVNPLQFGPKEDLSRYPRPLDQDLALCRDLGVDAVFTPTVETLYPEGMDDVTTIVPPGDLTDRLCGTFRPGHFTGVATVVAKLFNLLRPDLAIFGEKDAQQLIVIQKMVQDLHFSVKIVPHPTIREESGLALSSRNRYLETVAEKRAALCLYRILTAIREKVALAAAPLETAQSLDEISREILQGMGDSEVSIRLQYLEAVDKNTFAPVQTLGPDSKVLIAAYINEVRLIDNLDLG